MTCCSSLAESNCDKGLVSHTTLDLISEAPLMGHALPFDSPFREILVKVSVFWCERQFSEKYTILNVLVESN